LEQTYTNWELLIQDDCSTDSTALLIRPIVEADTRIKYQKNSHNSGAAITRNNALRRAKGKWIAFLDSDDLWMHDKLAKQISYMIEHNYAFTYTQSEYINECGTKLNILETGPKEVGYRKLLFFNFLSTCSVVYNRDDIGLIQIPDLKKRNDYAMWLMIARKVPCRLLAENLAKYRIRTTGNLSGKSKGVIGQRDLLLSHYKMFRQSENYNPLTAWLLVGVNIVGYIWKRCLYVNKVGR
jgi:glycosyltransferase involved in cell wall biosynthesis